ncbi:DUF11 domain-containing protein [Nocardioides donggukensis]|uniref:DUF11 domain-containing protein n=1 Tax=Nocardioides donggukensis TaxID=2774019 RepID=A0A927K7M6_9ACTN|nr:DUF11 domain-containing protein [Nocardioides donggukensis]MBD8869170.1 DUF11 domain-containing protein [Nocardioides donggukensis]
MLLPRPRHTRARRTRQTRRTRRTRWSALTGFLVLVGLVVVVPASPAFAAEGIAVTKSASEQVLVGEDVAVTITARNTGTEKEYNLTLRDVLPLGVEYAGPTRPAGMPEPTEYVDSDGRTVLVWENVSDLPVGAAQSVSFAVRPDPDVHPVGSTIENTANAYANAGPRTLPRFDGQGQYVSGATVQATSGPASTTITAITVDKSEDSPEGELLRGIHAHPTTYTLRVTNNSAHADDDVVLVDHLPAELEFLGCGLDDNSATVEYTGAPRLDVSTPDVAGCIEPAGVATVTDPAGLPSGVYTRVEWRLGTLGPGDVVDVVHAAGIPQRANTATFPGGAPTPASLGQGSNLDNNTGAPTRETGSEIGLTNRAVVTADYTGPTAGDTGSAVSDSDQLAVTAEDLAIQKSVSPAVFSQGDVATYTLELQAGEYADTTGIVITDEMPDGLCPLAGPGTNFADGAPAPCDGSAGTAPSLPFTAVQNGDGTFTLTFDAIDIAASGTATVTYQARMLGNYRDTGSDPTVAGDAYTNTVDLTGESTTLASVDAPGGVSTVTVQDGSSASLSSGAPVLDKRIQPNSGPVPHTCSDAPADYEDAADLTAAETTFTQGSRVCFLLSIDFPAGSDTKNPVLVDLLPDNLDYEAGSAVAVTGNDVTTSVDETELTFTLGDAGASGRFVPKGSTFRYRISAVVNGAPAGSPDVTGNLAKLEWVDTDGTVGFLRDQEDFTIPPVPPVSVAKSAARITATPPGAAGPLPDGSTAQQHRIRAGDVVAFTVSVRNDGTAADLTDRPVIGPDAWDRLPVGITCLDVSAISDGGACTDPGDATHPDFAGNGTRSAVRWDLPDATEVAAGAALDLDYRVTYPVTVATNQSYRNDVDVASYATRTNLDALVQHHPADNVDTTVAADDEDVPRAHDDHTLRTPNAGITKANTTSVDDTTQGGNPTGLNYAAVGETVTYTVLATVPANTTVYGGVLTDQLPSGIRIDAVTYEYRPAPTDLWLALPLPGWSTSSPPAQARVDFPDSLDAGVADDQVRMTIEATVLDATANIHPAVRTNTARLASFAEDGSTALGTRSASSSVTVVEPVPAPTKAADDREPVADQVVGYTVTARNVATGSPNQVRPTLYDAVLVDCVPAGLTVQPGSLDPSTGTATTEAVGTNGCDADRTPVVWQVGDLAWRSAAEAAPDGANPWPTLDYAVTTSPAAGGGVSYRNTATLTGTSLDGASADERSYTGTASETITVPGGAVTKSVDEQRVRVGDRAAYEVTADLPADVNFYDASIIDLLPAGIDPATVTLVGSTCTYDDVAAGACATTVSAGDALTPSGQRHGWFLDDVAADPRPRTISVSYTAVVGVVAGNTAGTTLSNSADLRWNQTDTVPAGTTPAPDATFDSATEPDTATVTVSEPDLGITKSVSPADPVPGESFTYTVRVTNASGANVSAAHDVDLTDTVPSGVVVDATSISNGGTLTGGATGGGTIGWVDLGPIAPGGTVVLTYDATLVSPAPSTAQRNTIDITEYTSLDDGGRTYDGPTASATVTPGLPVLEVDKTLLDPAPAYIGEATRWQIEVTNSGPATAYDVDVRDVLPEDWTYDADSARISVAGAPAAADEPDSVTGDPVQTLTWDALGDLATGERIVVVLSATPGADVAPDRVGSGTSHTNEATATAQDLDGAAGSVVTTDSDDASTRIDSADLRMTKTAVGTPVAGAEFSWTLSVANLGSDTAAGPISVSDTVPGIVTGATATGTGWTCTTTAGTDGPPATPTTVDCDRTDATDSLASGSSFPDITLTATVPDDTTAGTTLVNEATVEGHTFDPVAGNDTDDASSDVTVESDFGIDKTLSGALVPGSEATYRLAVTNHGPSVSRGPITVVDTLPTGLTYDSFTGAGWSLSRSGQELTFTWTGDTPVAVGALPTIVITADVDPDLTADVRNVAAVSEPTDPTSGDEEPDSDSVTTTPAPSADLSLEKASVGTFKAGEQGTYRFTVTNSGPSAATGPLRLTDTLPSDVGYVSAVGDGWACTASGQDVTCTRTAGLAFDGETTFDVTVDLDEGLTGDVTNEATVSSPTTDPAPVDNTDGDDSGITVESDLSIVKTLTTDPVVAGENASFTLQVRNQGPATSPGTITVTDTLPSGLGHVSATGTGWDCSAADGVVTCDRDAALGADSAAPAITLVARVDSGIGSTTLQNTATVDGPATDPVATNDTSRIDVPVTEDTEISVAKTTTGADPVRAGENATFRLVVSNTGSSDARSVRVTDTLPSGMTLVSVGGTGWTCSDNVCSRDRIVAGTAAPALTVVATVAAGTPHGSTLTNRAAVSTTTPGDTDAGNTASADVDVVADADLAINKVHGSGAAVAGESTTFLLEVSNEGPSDAVGPITVVDTLPAGLSYLSASAPWSCSEGDVNPQRVTCTVPGGLVSGADAPDLRIQVMVAADADTGTVTNSATVGSPTADTTPGNDTDTADLAVAQEADLSIVKDHTGPVKVGEELSFTLDVANDGPSEARSVTVTDDLPTGLRFVSAVGTDWTCDQVDGTVTCDLAGPLGPMASAPTITLTVEVLPAAYPAVDNVAVVDAATPEADEEDNSSSDTVTVPALVDLALTKTLTGDLVVGEEGSYLLEVTNDGPTPAPGPITVTDDLPEGLTYVAAEGADWTCSSSAGLVTCERTEPLGVGESTVVELTVAVQPSAYPTVENSATVTSDSEETDGPGDLDNTGSAAAGVTPTVVLDIEKDAVNLTGDRVTYRITVLNEGPSATVKPVTVVDDLPDGLRLVRVGGKGWSCAETPRKATCTLAASLAAGEDSSITLVADITAAPGTEVVNVATVKGGGGGSSPAVDDAAITSPAAPQGAGTGGTGVLPNNGGPLWYLGLSALLLIALGLGLTRHARRTTG